MLESGADIRTMMAITGHKSVAMFQRYSHPSQPHLKTAVERLCQNGVVTPVVTQAVQAAIGIRKSLKGL